MKGKSTNHLFHNKISGRTKELLSLLSRNSIAGLMTVKRAAVALNLSPREAAIKLSGLEKKGWLKRIKRGTYFVLPLEATMAKGAVAGDPWIIASVVFMPCYIGGWSAAEYWELTEQLFRSTFVVTSANVRSKDQAILGNNYRVVRVSDSRFHGTKTVWRGSYKVSVSDREQTLIDGMLNPHWVGGFKHLADMFYTYVESENRDLRKLLDRAITIDKGSIYKRLGFLLERLRPNQKRPISLIRERVSSGLIKLDPSVSKKGRINRRWGIWENVSV